MTNPKMKMTILTLTILTTEYTTQNVMQAIRNMEPAWVKVNGLKFQLIEYTDNRGRLKPCYQLTKTECLYIDSSCSMQAMFRPMVCTAAA